MSNALRNKTDIIDAPPVGFLREGKLVLAIAVLIVGVMPSKEAAFGLAILWLVVLRPLSRAEVWGVLSRLWPILLMLAIAAFMTMVDVSDSFDRRGTIRILFYYVRIPIFLMLGFAARKYMRRPDSLFWMLILLGIYSSSNTLVTYLVTDVSRFDRTTLRQVIGAGDPMATFVPIIAWILWSRHELFWQRALLLLGGGLSLLSILVTQSRTGLVIVALSFVLILPGMRPLRWVRWGVLAILIVGFVVTTPLFPTILHIFSVNPADLSGLNEIVARPRYDFSLINKEWRGYETYRAFLAAETDGTPAFVLGHGLSALASLGVYIELAPGQLFNRIDIFHNGYSFIILHSGLLGVILYMAQLWIFSRPQAAIRFVIDGSRISKAGNDDLVFVLVMLSLAASTSVIAGLFNASTFASLHLFLLGCFYPLRKNDICASQYRSVPRSARDASSPVPVYVDAT